MKILMLNNEYPPLGGGQANANYYLYKEFEKYKDIQIDIITSSIDKYREQETKIGKIYFLDIRKKGRNPHFQTSKELITWSIKTLKLAKKLIQQKEYDLIVAWSGVPAGYLAYRLNKKLKVPYIVLLRGSDVPFWDKRFRLLDSSIFSKLSPKVWKNAKKVIANSEELRSKAREVSERQEVAIIPNGVDTNYFKPIKKKGNKTIKIIYSGRLNKIKGVDILISAISKINKHFELILVGDGPEKENLIRQVKESKISKKVKFLGIKDKKELLKLYQNSDVFILPSRREGMSNSLLEAMACGLPVIATDVGGSKELIKGNGFIVPVENNEELKNKIERILNNPTMMKKMGKQSRKIAENIGWARIASKFKEEFEK